MKPTVLGMVLLLSGLACLCGDPDSTARRSASRRSSAAGDQGEGQRSAAAAPMVLKSVDVKWTPKELRFEIDAMNVSELKLGLAETAATTKGWYGEDCKVESSVCHSIAAKGGRLEKVQAAGQVGDGHTLFNSDYEGCLTFVLQSNESKCWAWGHDPSYYSSLGCTVIPTRNPPCRSAQRRSSSRSTSGTSARRGSSSGSSGRTTRACCRVCSTGKACGNSCISRSRSCNKGPGCACNAR